MAALHRVVCYSVELRYVNVPTLRRIGVNVLASVPASERVNVARRIALDLAGPLPVESVNVVRLPGVSHAVTYSV
jgi:hypothetical protein